MAKTTRRSRSRTPNTSGVTSVFLDAKLLRALKAEAKRREDSVGKLLRLAAREWLAKHAGRDEALPNLDSTSRNDDWIHRRRAGGAR